MFAANDINNAKTGFAGAGIYTEDKRHKVVSIYSGYGAVLHGNLYGASGIFFWQISKPGVAIKLILLPTQKSTIN
jgi:hypothetical protein